MGIKNYAIAFQIAAAFRGNSAFTDVAQSIKKLKAEYHDIGSQSAGTW